VKLVLKDVVLVNKTLITVLVVLVLELKLHSVDVQFLTMKNQLIFLVLHVCKNVLLVPMVLLVILVMLKISE
jgi:hypothetical protein